MAKRYRIEVQKNGVAIYDKENRIYLIDASTIQTDDSFTIAKEEVVQVNRYKWISKYYFNVLKPKKRKSKNG